MEHGTLAMNYMNTIFKFMKTPILGVFIKKIEAQSGLEQVWVPHTLHESWQKIV